MPRPWWKDLTVVTSGHISASKQESDSSDRPLSHLSPCFILLQFLSILLRVTWPGAFLLPLLSFLRLPPTISLSLACASSGHGSLSKLQRGRVWTGELSYFPSPLHDTQTQIHAHMHFLYPWQNFKHVYLLFPCFNFFIFLLGVFTYWKWSYFWIHRIAFKTSWSVDGPVSGELAKTATFFFFLNLN